MLIQSNKQLEDVLRQIPALEEELRQGKSVGKVLSDAGIEIGSPLSTDKWIYRIVVSALGLVVLIAVCGSIYLAINQVSNTPEILVAIGSAAVGALAGLLAPSPK
jgi:hypothetical protein